MTILVHWSCQISDSSHIETEMAICKIGIMMLWDHAHPYIQSTTVLCDIKMIMKHVHVMYTCVDVELTYLLNNDYRSTPRRATTQHILNGCKVALNQGRYTWRHDSVLNRLV